MKLLRTIASAILVITVAICVTAGWIAPHHYSTQYRDHADEPPSGEFPLGTDELGRDRFSRLLYATRVSMTFAPMAALLATMIAACAGIAAGYGGAWLDWIVVAVMDWVLSLPWLFALLTFRSLLPLEVSPMASLAVTFVVLAGVGWAFGARIVRANVIALRDSEAMVQARAYGCDPRRLLFVHILPNVRSILAAQFWILVPVFLLTEANLGMLGLGLVEPVPSLGNLLMELQSYDKIAAAPWMLAPAILLIIVVASLHLVLSGTRTWE
jgi:peptide/nickel transport system permease protein